MADKSKAVTASTGAGKVSPTGDVIVYTTTRNGVMKSAAFKRDGVSPDYEVGEFNAVVVNIEETITKALAKLTPLDRLVLGLDE